MTTSQSVRSIHERTTPMGAVVWLDGQQAMVATSAADGRISTTNLDRGAETEVAYLARVVHAIGERERVVILGPSSPRLALEREYVAIFRRPDRLVDVEAMGSPA